MIKCNSLGITHAMDIRLSEIQATLKREDLSKFLCHVMLDETVFNWGFAQWCKDKIPKFIIQHTILHSLDSHTDAIDFRSIRDFPCYSSLLSYHSSCVSEVKAMRSHELSHGISLYEFMIEEISTLVTLTERDILRFETFEDCNKKYPMYSDFIYEKFAKIVLKDTSRVEEYILPFPFREHCVQKISWVKDDLKGDMDTKHMNTKSAETGLTRWEQCIFDLETNRMYDGAEAKLVLRYTLLKFFENREYEDMIDLNMYEYTHFYPSLLIFFRNCLLQVEDMERDTISDSLSVHDLMVDKGLEQDAGNSTDNSALRMEQLFERVINGKYYLYRDIVASKIKRSVLMDKLLDLHPFTCIDAKYEATKKKSALESVVVVEVTKYLSSANLLNLVLAFSPSYNNYCVEKHSSVHKRQIDESQGSSKRSKCSD